MFSISGNLEMVDSIEPRHLPTTLDPYEPPDIDMEITGGSVKRHADRACPNAAQTQDFTAAWRMSFGTTGRR